MGKIKWFRIDNEIYEVAEIDKDGSCLFAAISDQLRHTLERKIGTPTPLALRTYAVDHMRNHLDDYKDFLTLDPTIYPHEMDWKIRCEIYLEAMKLPATWGGEQEIKALADALNIQIHVAIMDKSGACECKSTSKESRHEIYLVYSNNNHYNSLRKIELPTSDLPDSPENQDAITSQDQEKKDRQFAEMIWQQQRERKQASFTSRMESLENEYQTLYQQYQIIQKECSELKNKDIVIPTVTHGQLKNLLEQMKSIRSEVDALKKEHFSLNNANELVTLSSSSSNSNNKSPSGMHQAYSPAGGIPRIPEKHVKNPVQQICTIS